MAEHLRNFEAFLETANGRKDLDLTNSLHFLLINATKRELRLRDVPIPETPAYCVVPYIQQMVVVADVIEMWEEPDPEKEGGIVYSGHAISYVFVEDDEFGRPAAVPVDLYVDEGKAGGYEDEGFTPKVLAEFRKVAAARTGMLN